MKKSRFSEAQIVGILKEVEMGAKVAETHRKHGVSEATYYKWKSQFSVLWHDGLTLSPIAPVAGRECQAQTHVCRLGAHAPRAQGRC